MTIARLSYLLLSVPPLLAVGFGIGFNFQFAQLSARGAQQIGSLRRSDLIGQQLSRSYEQESSLLARQFQALDPAFPDQLRRLNYQVGETCNEYLRLDIGVEERVAVEQIKALQAELSLVALQVFRDLQAGAEHRAALAFIRAGQLEGEIHGQFERLSTLQLASLGTVIGQLNETARRGIYTVAALVATLLATAIISTAVMRRRLLQPIKAVLQTSERMRLGDLSARAPAGRDDEVGRLTHGFNFMAASLAESHANLERRIEERTAQLRALQDQLVQAEKLSAMGLLVGGVAHELNNPLSAIMGFNELARQELAGVRGSETGTRLLEQIDGQVERCRRIVGNLLQFARRQDSRMAPFEVNPAVEQIIELRAYELSTRNCRVASELDPANPVAHGDRDKIQQVMLNLLNNAYDAIAETGQPGTVTVRTKADGGRVVLEVQDDGAGFREPARAFDPFYTTKEVGKGTGLGLSVCYGIIEEHGGRIAARNLDPGALVSVALPAGDRAGIARAASGPPSAVGSGSAGPATPRGLIVDDEEALVRLQVAFLQKLGVQAHGVTSGEEAIRHLEQHPADVIVSDIRMAGPVDGVQLYEWVRVNRPELAGHFLFASGDLIGLTGEFFERTPVPRIAKPFRFEAYARAVRDALRAGGAPE